MQSISRRNERTIFIIASVWQVLSGVYTAFVYAIYLKRNGVTVSNGSELDMVSAQMIANNLFTVAFTIGVFFMILGIINFFIAKRIKDDQIERKFAWWYGGCAVICFLMMDLISVGLLMIGSVLMLAKNKAVKYKRELVLEMSVK
ncbi:MAG: hypothetical protein ACRCST_07235 [Turicibacter sp.]